jgi:hypothetical protein
VADDLTQYWYHRLHHQLPWLWRFHRTHHSAPYMGMAMASRQNLIYTIFFSQTYLTAALVYLGLGFPALFVKGIKSLITTAAHSSIKWDKPFYTIKWLKPTDGSWKDWYQHLQHIMHIMLIQMMMVLVIIKATLAICFLYGISYLVQALLQDNILQLMASSIIKQEEWYAQFLWPIFKSKKEGSELHKHGPMVGDANLMIAKVAFANDKEIKTLKPA